MGELFNAGNIGHIRHNVTPLSYFSFKEDNPERNRSLSQVETEKNIQCINSGHKNLLWNRNIAIRKFYKLNNNENMEVT